MKYTIVSILLLWISCNVLIAQETEISGKISSEESLALKGATIQIYQGAAAITDDEGRFSINSIAAREAYRLRIQMIGYAPIDTIIRTNTDKIFLTIEMKAIVYEQAPVEITASGFNVFKYSEWKILDFQIYKNKLLILSLLNGKRKIGLYELSGLKIKELDVEDKYNQLYVSCTNGIHLLGRNNCYELQVSAAEIVFLKKYDRTLFDQLLAPCLMEVGAELVFKKLSRHNKRAQYYKFLQAKKTKLIKEVYDLQSAEVAQSYYNEIIGLYYKAVASPEEHAIDGGESRINIIARGEWSGNLMDLMLNTDLHFAIAYYKNVESKAIHLLEFEHNGFFYMMDFVNKSMHKINVENLKTKELSIPSFEWNKKTQVLKDEKSDLVYLLLNKTELYLLNFKKDTCELLKQADLDLETHFPKGIKIHDHHLYYFSSPDITNRSSQLYKQRLN